MRGLLCWAVFWRDWNVRVAGLECLVGAWRMGRATAPRAGVPPLKAVAHGCVWSPRSVAARAIAGGSGCGLGRDWRQNMRMVRQAAMSYCSRSGMWFAAHESVHRCVSGGDAVDFVHRWWRGPGGVPGATCRCGRKESAVWPHIPPSCRRLCRCWGLRALPWHVTWVCTSARGHCARHGMGAARYVRERQASPGKARMDALRG